MKRVLPMGLALIVLMFVLRISFAADPPHSLTGLQPISCGKCHALHNAPGTSLTNKTSNENLCLSCHTSGNPMAGTKPFSAQTGTSVIPGTIGNQHSWIASMPLSSSPSNTHGLRATSDLRNADLKARLAVFGDIVTCSVCHNQHNQQAEPWDPDSPTPYTKGTSTNRHLMRTDFLCVNDKQCYTNEINDLCQDCHYYRALSYTTADGEDPSYPANGINVFSHSVGDTLNYRGYDRPAPLDFDGREQQTSPRYKNNSTGDTNKTNNIVLDSSRKIRCMSCHRIHYVDSNGLTVDAP